MCQKVIWGRSSDVSDDFLKKHLFCSEMIQVCSRWLLCNISVKLENRDFDLIDVGGDYSLSASDLFKSTLFLRNRLFLSNMILIGCHFNKWKFLLRYRTFRKNAPLGKTYFMLRRYFRHSQVPTTSMLSRSLFFVVCAIVRK